MSINWYPGHMAKTKRLIKEKISLIDIIYEVVDARIPFSSRVKDIDDYIKNKPKIIIMTKIDLCDLRETDKWVKHYQTNGIEVVKVDLKRNINIEEIIKVTNKISNQIFEKRTQKGLQKRATRALIMGAPNVGKSTLINRLAGKKVAAVGNKPGITKGLEWIRINKEIEMMDSPGILWPKIDNEQTGFNLAALSIIKEEIIPIDEVSVYILKMINKYYSRYLKERYDISEIDYENIYITFEHIGKKRGYIIKGGQIDYLKVSSSIVKDLNEGKLGVITFDRFVEGVKNEKENIFN